ncbi:hypothetical protein BH24DEI1_BH24DEI1_06860 [soil metagenome]|jgi:hypothetical protein
MQLKRGNAIIVLTLLSLLTSCLQKTYYDFNTHPSILRGDWIGMVENFPREGDTTELRLLSLQATFLGGEHGIEGEYGRCDGYVLCHYHFSGTFQLGTGTATEVEGYGHAGNGGIYTQTQGPRPPAFRLKVTRSEHVLEIYGFYNSYLLGAEEPPPMPAYASHLIIREMDGRIGAEYPFNLLSLTPSP